MIDVHNEVGELHRVLVHKPGPEVVRMTQFELEPLLFDDILSLDLAQKEHAMLQEILGHQGAEILEVMDVLKTALARTTPEQRRPFLARVCELSAVPDLAGPLGDWEPEKLACALVEGLEWDEIGSSTGSLRRIRARLDPGIQMAIPPVPNLMFMRDPCITLYDKVMVGRMATEARARESLLVHFAMRYGLDEPIDFLFDEPDWSRHSAFRSIEGGDVLVLSDEVLLIGCSQRTREETIERVASQFLFPAFPKLRKIYAVMMPMLRSVMHLDTILTAVDRNLFLGHAPMIEQGKGLTVVELARGKAPLCLDGLTVADLLRQELGDQTIVVPCGGDEPLHQLREQWTDGANAVCLGPGRIVLYARNVRTARALVENHGFKCVELSAFQSPDERRSRLNSVQPGDRVVYTFGGGELSRARGGGRCLTMPLTRGR